jgi:hypothetical protein
MESVRFNNKQISLIARGLLKKNVEFLVEVIYSGGGADGMEANNLAINGLEEEIKLLRKSLQAKKDNPPARRFGG